MASEHVAEYIEDPNGWWYVTCWCGWAQGPAPSQEDISDSYADHRADVAAGGATPEAEENRP